MSQGEEGGFGRRGLHFTCEKSRDEALGSAVILQEER